MNKTKMLCAASAAMTLTFAGAATTYEVHNVDELTNACAKATTNQDTIKIYPGTYDLSGITMATETLNKETHGIHLQFKMNYMKILGMGATPDETIIKGGGAVDKQRLMVFKANYNTISNLTFTGGYVDTAAGSGGVCMGRNQTFIDCRFVGNYAGNFAGAIDQPTKVTKCYFENNVAANSGGVYRGANGVGIFSDCTFLNNSSIGGGIGYGAAVFTNCVFVQNHSTGSHGILKTGGASAAFTHCFFTNNYVAESCSICDSVGGITNCTFYGNRAGVWGTHTGDTVLSKCKSVVGCTFLCNTGMPMVTECSFADCTFTGNVGHRQNSNGIFDKSTFCNCLLAGNQGGIGNATPLIAASKLYNCTVVTNKYQGANYVSMLNSSSVAVNTIFADNYLFSTDGWNPGETIIGRRDVRGETYSPLMTNCLWTAQSGTIAADKAIGGGLVADAKLRFTDAANGDYTIQRKSVARNAGWSDAAYLEAVGSTDLKGDARVFEDTIDVGCYECVLPPPGLRVLVR